MFQAIVYRPPFHKNVIEHLRDGRSSSHLSIDDIPSTFSLSRSVHRPEKVSMDCGLFKMLMNKREGKQMERNFLRMRYSEHTDHEPDLMMDTITKATFQQYFQTYDAHV